MDDLFDAGSGAFLEVAGDGQGGEHYGEVCFYRVAFAVEDGACGKVGFRHTEGLLDVPQIVVAADHFISGHGRGGYVRDVAFQPDQVLCLLEGDFVEGESLCRPGFEEACLLRRFGAVDDP